MQDVQTAKREWRLRLLARGRETIPEECRRMSHGMCGRLLGLPELRHARRVAMYAAMPGEADPGEVFTYCLQDGKEVLLPRYDAVSGAYVMVAVRDPKREIRSGRFGIREPLPELPAGDVRGPETVWLVPGLGFDREGRRLGRGRGFFDRLLTGTAGFKIGIGFSWQLLPELPADDRDVRMDAVVTETETVRFRSR